MKTIYHMKPQLDASGASPSPQAQQNALAKEKKKKANEEKPKQKGLEKGDGGPGSGPQPGGGASRRKGKRRGKSERRLGVKGETAAQFAENAKKTHELMKASDPRNQPKKVDPAAVKSISEAAKRFREGK